jgi:hypothetical protein
MAGERAGAPLGFFRAREARSIKLQRGLTEDAFSKFISIGKPCKLFYNIFKHKIQCMYNTRRLKDMFVYLLNFFSGTLAISCVISHYLKHSF